MTGLKQGHSDAIRKVREALGGRLRFTRATTPE